MSKILSLVASLSLLASLVSSHSWLECSKYGIATDPPLDGKSYDPAACTGYPRGWAPGRANSAFGQDTGFNVQPGPNWCAGRSEANGNYPANFPMAQYAIGEKVRLVWPAKNHDAAACTNPFIPDTEMKIYATPVTSAQIAAGYNGPTDLAQWTMVVDFKQTQIPSTPNPEGFQRCPDFCGALGTDKAICFQDFTVPALQGAGTYLFLWFWIFNAGGPNTAYTTCWDATVTGQGTGTVGNSAGSGPTTAPGSEQSLTFEITSTGGTFDQTRLRRAVATELSVQECAVILASFSGDLSSFNAFYSVNVAQASVASATATINSAAFDTALGASTGGTVTVTAPSVGAAASGGCSSSGSTRVTTFSLTLVVRLTGSPYPSAVDVAVAIDAVLLSQSINADVGCTSTNGTSSATGRTYSCSVIVFSSADSVSAQTFLSNSALFPAVLAADQRMSCCTSSQVQTVSVSANVRPSTNYGLGGSPRSVRLSPVLAVLSVLVFIGTMVGVF